jgi:hypothetical protein
MTSNERPVAWCVIESGRVKGLCKSIPAVMNADKWQPLYAEPPQREWVGLTDEQVIKLAQEWPADETNDWASYLDFARAVEAKLKQLNQRNGSANGSSHERT